MPKTIIIEPGELLDVDEAAKELGIGVATVWRWIKKGSLVPLKLGGRTLIHRSEIDRIKNQAAEDTAA